MFKERWTLRYLPGKIYKVDMLCVNERGLVKREVLHKRVLQNIFNRAMKYILQS